MSDGWGPYDLAAFLTMACLLGLFAGGFVAVMLDGLARWWNARRKRRQP